MPFPLRAHAARQGRNAYMGYAAWKAAGIVRRSVAYLRGRVASRTAASSSFRAGRDRTGGYYGRFSGKGASEYKFIDTTIAPVTITGAGDSMVDSLNVIAQGSKENERIGRRCTIRHISVDGMIQADAVELSGQGTNQWRVVLVLDKQANGASPVWLDVFDRATIHSPFNLQASNRFTILAEKRFTMNRSPGTHLGASDGEYPNWSRAVRWNKNVNVKIEYSDTFIDGRMTTIRSNNLKLFAISDSTGVIGAFHAEVRLRYSDD